MDDFVEQYRAACAALGRPLRARDATPEREIAAAEKRLGIRAPKALRDFHRLAGRAVDVHSPESVQDVFLKPAEWEMSQGRLVFHDTCQSVVAHGCLANDRTEDDPPAWVSECYRGHEGRWYRISPSVSEFILAVTHMYVAWQGSMGHAALGAAPRNIATALRRKWRYVGYANEMRAFRQDGCAACVMKDQSGWQVFLGAATPEALDAGIKLLPAAVAQGVKRY